MGPDFDGKVVEPTGVNQGTTKLLLVAPETTPVQTHLSFKGLSFESGGQRSVQWAAYLEGEPVQQKQA